MNPELAPRRGPCVICRTLAWQTAIRIVFANLGGAAIVFSYVQYAEPSRGADLETHWYFMVASGVAVAGNIGARQRVEYTVIGDPVNEASRLTDLAKGYASRVLASSNSVFKALQPEQDRWDYVGAIVLRGRDQLTETYEPTPTATNESR